MNHCHHNCEHKSVKYCKDCNMVYCEGCKETWEAKCTKQHGWVNGTTYTYVGSPTDVLTSPCNLGADHAK